MFVNHRSTNAEMRNVFGGSIIRDRSQRTFDNGPGIQPYYRGGNVSYAPPAPQSFTNRYAPTKAANLGTSFPEL